MKTALVVFGVLAALFGGLATLFTLGETMAILVVVALVGAVVAGFFVRREVGRVLVTVVVVAFLGSVAFISFGAAQLVAAFSTTGGPVDPADPVALAAADAKVDEVRDAVAFRLELTEDEMTAYVLDGLQDVDDNPLRSVSLDVVDGAGGDPGRLDFTAEFKGGGVGASGSVTVALEQGRVQIDLADISVGSFDMPGVAQSSL
jgi:hypothetical protein